MNITLIIRALDFGGAERQLIYLANGLAQTHSVTVVTFYPGGDLAGELAPAVRRVDAGKRGRGDIVGFLRRFRRAVAASSPEVIYTFMDVPNILATLLRPLLPPARLVWGVRASNMQMANYDWLSRAAVRVEALLSRFADRIICNSASGARAAAARGFPASRLVVIPNGTDTERYRPRPGERKRLRAALQLAPACYWIALIGRIDPMKGHEVFLEAAARLAGQRSDVRFLVLGDGPPAAVNRLKAAGAALGLGQVLLWMPARGDMADVLPALDIVTSASIYGEGLSNVIAEAMACGLDCVVTDVGDSAQLVGEAGHVVPPGEPEALARAWHAVLEARGGAGAAPNESARERIAGRFSVTSMVERTAAELAGC